MLHLTYGICIFKTSYYLLGKPTLNYIISEPQNSRQFESYHLPRKSLPKPDVWIFHYRQNHILQYKTMLVQNAEHNQISVYCLFLL